MSDEADAGREGRGVIVDCGFLRLRFLPCAQHSLRCRSVSVGLAQEILPGWIHGGGTPNGKGFYDPLVYVLEYHRLGLKLLPPDVNEPGPAFVTHGNSIRVPVTRLKGLSERSKDRILAVIRDGKFTTLADFFTACVL